MFLVQASQNFHNSDFQGCPKSKGIAMGLGQGWQHVVTTECDGSPAKRSFRCGPTRGPNQSRPRQWFIQDIATAHKCGLASTAEPVCNQIFQGLQLWLYQPHVLAFLVRVVQFVMKSLVFMYDLRTQPRITSAYYGHLKTEGLSGVTGKGLHGRVGSRKAPPLALWQPAPQPLRPGNRPGATGRRGCQPQKR